MIKRSANNISPLGRWIKNQIPASKNIPRSYRDEESLDPIAFSHWIVYGLPPTVGDLSFWSEKLGTCSLYHAIHEMHQASLPSTQAQWRKIYQTMGVSGPNSSRSLRSPTLAAVRVYLNENRCEPSPAEIITHLKVLLRGPTSIESFMDHVERKIYRRRGENKGKIRAIFNNKLRRISKTTIQNEIIMISDALQSIATRDSLLYLSRLISPIPESLSRDGFATELMPTQVDQIEFDEKLRPFSIDLKQVYEDIKPLLAISGGSVTEEIGQKIVDNITKYLPNDQGEAFVVLLYKIILNRSPDLLGYESHIFDLRSGDFNYIDILNRFLGSEEFTLSVKSMENNNDTV